MQLPFPQQSECKSITLLTLEQMRKSRQKIAMLTCYDASFARLLDHAGIDAILVGDSLGNVIQGHANTLKVSLEEMVYHTKTVANGVSKTLIVSDLPFGYLSTPERAYEASVALIKAGASVIKIEGSAWLAETFKYLTERAIPICAHIGLTPQSVHQLSGFKVQGRDDDSAEKLIRTAKVLEKAGARMIVIESVPALLANQITESVSIPTIGIGAGKYCSGQILVLYDILGIYFGRTNQKAPRFTKNFLVGCEDVFIAVQRYIEAVKTMTFPNIEHSY